MDVGLCLRILPVNDVFEFIVESDKLEKVKKVVFHNDGEIVSESPMGTDVRVKIRKKGLI